MTADARETIIDAAIVLFARHGFKGVTLRDIAQESGFLIGSIHHYFPKKILIYKAALRQSYAYCTSLIKDSLDELMEPRLKFRHAVEIIFNLNANDDSHMRMIDREDNDKIAEDLSGIARQAFITNYESLMPLIEEISPGNIAEGEYDWRASYVYSSIYGAAKLSRQYQRIMKRPQQDFRKKFLDGLVESTLRSIQP